MRRKIIDAADLAAGDGRDERFRMIEAEHGRNAFAILWFCGRPATLGSAAGALPAR